MFYDQMLTDVYSCIALVYLNEVNIEDLQNIWILLNIENELMK